MADFRLAPSASTGAAASACLVYLISPVHVISSLAALETLHQERNVRVTLLVHWPGVNDSIVTELLQIVRELTAPFGNIERVVALSSADKDGLLASLSLQVIAEELENRLGRGHFDELYYAHDIEGGMQQLLCTLFPEARRICYGDALGNVYEKKVHLSFLKRQKEPGIPAALAMLRRLLGRVSALGGKLLTGGLARRGRSLELAEFRAEAAALILPVDQSGHFLDGIPLTVCSRRLVFDLVGRCADACIDLNDYQAVLIERYRDRRTFLLLTENSAEGNFIDFQRETEMYCAVIRERCDPGTVIFLKSHPGETLPRNERISAILADDFEVVTLDPKFKRYPIELWRDLVSSSTVMCMSYPVLSLKYLYDIDVIQPMDDAFIERWYPEWTWASYKNAIRLYMEPLKRLPEWDGGSILWNPKR